MSRSDHLIGKWAAIAIVAIAAVYIATGATWLVSNINSVTVLTLAPSEPYLTILEILMLLFNPPLIALFAAIHVWAPPHRKAFSMAAFGFAILLVAITGVVHFVQLTVVRRGASPLVAEVFGFYHSQGPGHSAMFAAEMLGWDFFFGFAMLFAAFVFKGDKLQNAIRGGLILGGALCLIGFSGPASGDMRLQLPAIIGYAFVFPFVCLLLATFFTRADVRQTEPLDNFTGEKLN